MEYENAQKRILEVFTQWKAPDNFKIEMFVIRVGDWGGYMLLDCDDPLAVHKFCSMLPAFEFEARPVVPVMDAVRVDRWNGADIDVDAPLPSDLIVTAAEVRPEIMQHAGGYLSMAALPASLRAAEPIAREVYAGGWRPAYSPGPSRDELAEIVRRTVAQPQPA